MMTASMGFDANRILKSVGRKDACAASLVLPKMVLLGVADLGCRRRRIQRLFAGNLEFPDIAPLARGAIGLSAPCVARLTAARDNSRPSNPVKVRQHGNWRDALGAVASIRALSRITSAPPCRRL